MRRITHFGNLLKDEFKHRIKGRCRTDPKTVTIADSRVLYVPVPKAANTSTRHALCPCLHLPAQSVREVHKDPRIPIESWSNLTARIHQDSFLFTVVRNPYTRILSAYRDKVCRMGARLWALRAMGVEASDSFDTFLAACSRWPRKMLNDHFIPQSELLSAPMATGKLTIIKCEDLPRVWCDVADRIESAGVPRPDNLRHENRAVENRPTNFSAKQTSLIQKLYRDDFEVFGYSSQPPVSSD